MSDSPVLGDSNVLRKVASLTLDRATLESKISKPKFVPEKLDFQIYEKFEGNIANCECRIFSTETFVFVCRCI